jgi:hypothetical protein
MAARRISDPIEPMTLGNMRDNGEQVHKFTSEGVAACARRTVDNTGERVHEPALVVLLDLSQ